LKVAIYKGQETQSQYGNDFDHTDMTEIVQTIFYRDLNHTDLERPSENSSPDIFLDFLSRFPNKKTIKNAIKNL
jgi:hypothetical protein